MKVMTISDAPNIFSGLARVHRHVIDGLAGKGHEVMPCSWFAYDSPTISKIDAGGAPPAVSYDSAGKSIRLRPIVKDGVNPSQNGFRGMKMVYDAMEDFQPDTVITIGDHWDFYYMQNLKTRRGYSFKWFPCLTIERDDIEDKWLEMLKYADDIVVPSIFGQKVLKKAGFDSVVVPYGAEDVFKRASGERRAELRAERKCEGKVRFMTVGQNTWRKNLPALIQAVEQMAHRDPDKVMQFYLHTNFGHVDPQEQFLFDLKKIITKLGVQEWFVFPGCESSIFKAPSDSMLVDEYNASDFFVLPSSFEGYGLPVVEAMACGLPTIVSGTSTMPEHLGAAEEQTYGLTQRGFMVSSRVEIRPPDVFIRTVRPDALAQAIWEMRLFAGDKRRAAELEAMRAACEEYGRGKTWAAMSDSMVAIVEAGASKASRVPVDIL